MKTVARIFAFLFASMISVGMYAHAMPGMAMPREPELGASAAFDAHGRLWLVTAQNGHVLLQHSDDLGMTLSLSVEVNATAEKIYDEGENRPKIAIGPRSEIYVSWSHPLASPYSGYVRFARSLDGGRHFSAPITVNHDLAPITHRFDALAVDGRGRVVVAWVDGRDEAAAKARGKMYLGKALYYAWSGDEGKTFVTERKLIDHSCECCRIALARTPGGDVAAFFRAVFGDNIRDHAYAILRTGGEPATSRRATFENWHIEGCPHHGPGLAIGAEGTPHAVWYEANCGPAIWYGQLDPGHPPRHAFEVAGAGASHADVVVSGRAVWVTWNQVNAKGYTLMLRSSDDNGAHFGAARTIAGSAQAAGSPQLLLHDGRAYVAWNTAAGFRLIAVAP